MRALKITMAISIICASSVLAQTVLKNDASSLHSIEKINKQLQDIKQQEDIVENAERAFIEGNVLYDESEIRVETIKQIYKESKPFDTNKYIKKEISKLELKQTPQNKKTIQKIVKQYKKGIKNEN